MTTSTTEALFTDEASQGILDLWFGPIGTNPTQEHAMRWFRPDTSFDLEIRTKFGPLLTTLTTLPPSTLTTLATTPHRSLALLLLLDQFPRNLFRGPASAHVYTTTDPLAVAVATYSIAQRLDLGPNDGEWRSVPSRRMWFWLPFMHSEDPVLHARVRKEFLLPTAEICRGGEVEEGERGMAEKLVETGGEHEELLEIFGRYPYRNKVLGRESTKEELKWLENPVQWAR